MEINLKNCHDCNAEPGEMHGAGCDVERCSSCGGQRLQCGCQDHDPAFARWTGIWPGKAEAGYLGIDLNELVKYDGIFFVRPKEAEPDKKVFCKGCVSLGCSWTDGYGNGEGTYLCLCHHSSNTRDTWFEPNKKYGCSPEQKNKNNDCKDFERK